jgi:hypothetical protein
VAGGRKGSSGTAILGSAAPAAGQGLTGHATYGEAAGSVVELTVSVPVGDGVSVGGVDSVGGTESVGVWVGDSTGVSVAVGVSVGTAIGLTAPTPGGGAAVTNGTDGVCPAAVPPAEPRSAPSAGLRVLLGEADPGLGIVEDLRSPPASRPPPGLDGVCSTRDRDRCG